MADYQVTLDFVRDLSAVPCVMNQITLHDYTTTTDFSENVVKLEYFGVYQFTIHSAVGDFVAVNNMNISGHKIYITKTAPFRVQESGKITITGVCVGQFQSTPIKFN